ncbi:hypothetical protein [Streptomyces caniscabiei]|uniref:hypothetical protein n=1 Tax=Streptomyces caniscabiei TaxID=2746961 RepID=UPI000A36D3E7|nr:hypothetical protein [Streptomyces caniscabiei]
MSDRLTVDTITSDQLDALQDERDTLRQQLDAAHRRFDSLDAVVYSCGPHVPKLTAAHVTPAMERAATERARQAAAEHERAAEWFAANSSPHPAEAAVQRVTALRDRWVKAGPPPLGTPLARWWDKRLVELNTALAEPKEH